MSTCNGRERPILKYIQTYKATATLSSQTRNGFDQVYNSTWVECKQELCTLHENSIQQNKTVDVTNSYPFWRYISTQGSRPAPGLQHSFGCNVPVHANVSWIADAVTPNDKRIAIPSYSTKWKLRAHLSHSLLSPYLSMLSVLRHSLRVNQPF